jgi:hypothetical protein
MSNHATACHEHALYCLEVAEKTCTADDRREFLSFAQSWENLAIDIEQAERLVELIEDLTAQAVDRPAQPQFEESAVIEGSGLESLRRLVTVIATISEHVANEAANYLSTGKG